MSAPDVDRAAVAPHAVPAHARGADTADQVPADLPGLLGRLARRDPDRIAALDKGRDGTTIPVSRGELWQRTLSLAEELRTGGIGAGDCVAVWLPNWSDALAWQFAVAARGAHVIGINTRYNVDEVTHVLDRARPRLVALAHDFHDLDLLGGLREAVARSTNPPPAVAVVAGPGAPAVADPSASDVGGGAWAPATPVSAPPGIGGSGLDDLVVAFTTSGSTGMPKLAAHRAHGVLTHAVADATTIGIDEADLVLCALPLSGVFGYNTGMAALAAGATCVLQPVFDADTVLDDMAHHGVTHVVGGDDLVLRLAEAWKARPRDLSAWRWLGVADFQGRSRELAEWARDAFGTATAGVYGSSEVFALTAFWPHDEPAPGRWTGGGRVVHDGITVRVVDPVTGEELPPGQEGELQFRGPNVVDAYLGDDSAATKAFIADGWFHSGDLGALVDEGVFAFVCRMGDALRLRGFLVDPAEIERRLAEHPDVFTARVVGIPGPDGDTRAIGFVVPEEGRAPEPASLRDWCAETLARFKVPDAVHLIDAMPTTSGTNGTKIRAATLREWARQRFEDSRST
ncbi:AMP-binding protein [Pseudonocardia alaniniphila]|uniref:Long-chain-fatty-acid--CoA ligase n=1 Tax=Pseudonocardia alaniniphila TaxID=75291 RepID=A0ABS9TPI4_9PSEU|nr:AMP-binding protein [Pseudonocardia alaniniphila]MCH6170288.1 AMP-binding protein [Pseudonocardia alaniniphila]